MSSRRNRGARVLRPTLLIVGEGYADYHFLRHVRSLFTAGGCGPAVTVRNARGRGALNVIRSATSLSRDFDKTGAFFDTDTDWNEHARRLADSSRIITFANEPCIEAVLLRIAGETTIPANSQECKRAFRKKFKGDAHAEGLIPRFFGKDSIAQSRTKITVVDSLLKALGQ